MRFLVRFLAVVVVVGALLGAALTWKARDLAPTHPALTNLPPLINTRDFFADTKSQWRFRLSHDGAYVAYSGSHLGREVMRLKRLSDGKEIARIDKPQDYNWLPHGPYLSVTEDGRLWRVDPANPDRDDWADITPRSFNGWSINHRPADPAQRMMVSSTDRLRVFADVYTVEQDGTDREMLFENGGATLGWWVDADYAPILRMDKVSNTQAQWKHFRGNAWHDAFTTDENDTFQPFEPTDDGRMLAMSNRGRDKVALVSVDPATGNERVLRAHDTVDLWVGVNLRPFDGQIDLLRANGDEDELIAMTEAGEAVVAMLGGLAEPFNLDLLKGVSPDHLMAAISPSAQGYMTYHLDLEAQQMTELDQGSFRAKHLDKMASYEPVRFVARDGLEIPAYLLRAKGVSGPGPVVIDIHGGPAWRRIWEHQQFFQFLANRGYSVLTVNFRGSIGYGRDFMSAGFGEPGAAMQDDIVDAANWLVEQGIADPAAMAVMGGSYGGYAAGMAMTRDAGLFAAGIIEHAVLDVEYQMRNNPAVWGHYLEGLSRYWGDIDSPDDVAQMRALSPQTLVENLRDPVLLIAGRQDKVVGFEQTERFAEALDELDKPYQIKIFDRQGHGVNGWQDRVRHARLVEDFLAAQLGGRSGGWGVIEWAADLLD